MIQLLKEHITVRKYKNQPVSELLINDLFEAGCRASTTGNMQLYSIVHTTNQVLKEKLMPAHFNQKMIVEAPHVFTFCADFNRFKKWCMLSRAEPGYDNFLSFVTAAIDALLVAQNVCIAAESKGLGICYLGTTIYNADQIIKILNLPLGVVPITTLTIGWPDEEPKRVDRLPLEAIVHREIYHDYSDEQIKMVYQHKESLPESTRFIKENHKETLAQVFTDVRYKKSDNEFFSNKLIEVIRNQGFEF
jgi:nitroreductase